MKRLPRGNSSRRESIISTAIILFIVQPDVALEVSSISPIITTTLVSRRGTPFHVIYVLPSFYFPAGVLVFFVASLFFIPPCTIPSLEKAQLPTFAINIAAIFSALARRRQIPILYFWRE